LAQRFFELCKKHGVTRTHEGSWNTIQIEEERVLATLSD